MDETTVAWKVVWKVVVTVDGWAVSRVAWMVVLMVAWKVVE